MEEKSAIALAARRRGYSVIPLRGGDKENEDFKKPLIPWADYQSRKATPTEISGWNTDLFGVVTGPLSGILVVDIDSREAIPDFEDALRLAGLETVPFANTRRGRHYFFRWDGRLANKVTTKTRIGADRDVRGDGGYVVGWELDKLPAANLLPAVPQFVLDSLPDKIEARQIVQPVEQVRDELREAIHDLAPGNRNDTFTRLVGSFHARGYSDSFIFEVLRPKAAEVGFSLSELQTIIQSVGRYDVPADDTGSMAIDSFLAQRERVTWLCEPFIARQTIAFIAGLPETGKTWLLVDLAVESARGGGLWLGKFPVTGSRVLYVDQERFKGETQKRFETVINGKNIAPKQLRDSLFIRCGTTTRIDLQSSFDSFRKVLADIRPDMVLVDSFVTFHTKEENNRKEIQDVLERLKALRNEFGCAFVFVDHENKGAFQSKEKDEEPSALRMAGSIAKPAAAESVLTVRRVDQNESMVFHTKSTLAKSAAPFTVKITDMDAAKTKIQVQAY